MRTHLGFRQLETILAIAEFGSFSAASEVLHVSQPALSRTIRLAEEALGARLFDRSTRSVSLTAAGQELLPIARRIVAEFSDSMSQLAQFMEGQRGRIRVSALPSLAKSLMVDAIHRFNQSYPDIEFCIRTDGAEKVLAMIESCEIDIGITVQPPLNGHFAFQHLHDDEFMLFCRADDALAVQTPARRVIPWSVLEQRDFIAAVPNSNTRQVTDAAFMQLGLAIRPAHEASGDLSLIGGMVAAGVGVTVLPSSALATLSSQGLIARRLGKPVMKRRVGIVTRSGHTLSLAATRFCQLLCALGRCA